MRKILLLSLVTVVALDGCALFHKKKSPTKASATASHASAPSSGAPGMMNRSQAAAPKPYNQVITKGAKTDTGFVLIHKVNDRYFFEIPQNVISRDILVVSRIRKAAADVRGMMMGYAGDQINNAVVRFEQGNGHRLFLRSISFSERASDTTNMFQSVKNSNVQPIVAAFDVKAVRKDSVNHKTYTVIDVTDYLNTDNDVFFFDGSIKKALRLSAMMPDRSYVEKVTAYPTNVEIVTTKTYARTPDPRMGPMATAPGPATYELNSSMILLPEHQMQSRFADDRVGYFTNRYVDFDSNPQGVKNIAMITRWRLEPKPEDVEKYKRGELVEPLKPIVYYIDPATPKKWVPYLIQGVNDWQVAFEKAGFKNAIVAKLAPKDKNWSLDDASHNAIVYKPSDIPNASGPHVSDPRTGEILETHINWYHNVMSLVHNWYMVQAAAIDPRARKMQFDDELMGQLIRFVSSHEVGHTLGLRHNFGSSSTVPVEKLRDAKFLEKNGHTPSIMDYARFNYVAQPEDHVTEKGIFPRIGDYDLWAIEWGYRWFPEYKTPEAEQARLNSWIIDRIGKNPRLWFGTESDPDDPRCQNEDLGDNAMVASTYGIKNLKVLLNNLLVWTREPNEGYDGTKKMYSDVVNQFARYIGHVTKNVAGIYTTPKSVEEKGVIYQNVPAAKQKEAMAFLNKEVFNTPTWLLSKELTSKIGVQPYDVFRAIQGIPVSRLLTPNTILKLIKAEAVDGTKAYTVENMFSDLNKGIWTELSTHKKIDVYRRNLQKLYVANLIKMLSPTVSPMGSFDPTLSDISSIARAQLSGLQVAVRRAIPAYSGLDKAHLQDINARISTALNPK